jgi:predicted Zn-dependent peptidase
MRLRRPFPPPSAAALGALMALAAGCRPPAAPVPPPGAASAWPVRAARPADVSIPFEKYELDNGLDVLLSEDHSVPFVWVNLWYAVGSKDEVSGLTGFAHLFEHLMFQGSAHMDTDYFVPLQEVGASINGTTNPDRTNYFEGVPAEHLPLALWLESDRMGYLLPSVTQDRLANQQEVVRNERRQRYDNRPYGKVGIWLKEALYPAGHPYHVPTIGKHEDIANAKLEDVHAFFRTWYLPNNASLAIVGDFDPDEAKALVSKYFGPLPRGPQPSPVLEAPARLDGLTVRHYESRVPEHKVWVAWLTPRLFGAGDAELDLASQLLSDGKDSPLYRALVESGLATDASAYQSSGLLSSEFIVGATAAPGHSTDELVAAIDAVLARFAEAPPAADALADARTAFEVSTYERLQSISNKADMLNSYNVHVGDPAYLAHDLGRYAEVDPPAVQRAVREWLPPDRRVVLHVHPPGTAPEGAISDLPKPGGD